MTALATLDRTLLAEGLARIGAEGWLLFDFHGANPVAARLLPGGMGTRHDPPAFQNGPNHLPQLRRIQTHRS